MPRGVKDGVKYTRQGTPFECSQKGFGAGMMSEKTKNLPANSLQKIKYIGEKHEENFRDNRIRTTTALKNYAINNPPATVERMLRRVLVKSNGAFDAKAFNSVVSWLYSKQGVKNVPQCVLLR